LCVDIQRLNILLKEITADSPLQSLSQVFLFLNLDIKVRKRELFPK